MKAGGNQSPAHASFLLGLFLDSDNFGDMFLRNVCCVISQKIELFITTAVRTSDSTGRAFLPLCCLLKAVIYPQRYNIQIN
jgi:hypothetical protein